MINFLLSGLWHGADWNFILWRACHGVFSVRAKRYRMRFERLHPALKGGYRDDETVKHFEYDAIITGTSATQNFKTLELGKLFCVNSIKVPFCSASYKEINENLE